MMKDIIFLFEEYVFSFTIVFPRFENIFEMFPPLFYKNELKSKKKLTQYLCSNSIMNLQ
jgi:hypothetical protein